MVALALGMLGLSMLFYALEATSLNRFAAANNEVEAGTPARIYISMFVGLALLNLCVFWSIQQWSAYARAHPDVKHLPVWFLMFLIVAPVGGLVYSIASHASYVRSLDVVPVDPNLGFVAFQVLMATFVLLSLVLLAARWAPGYKRTAPVT